MTTKQENFCDEFILSNGNASAAARKAGYSSNGANVTAFNLLNRADVRKSINARLDELRSEKVADEKELLEFLTAAMRGQITETVVTNSGKAFEVPIRCSERLRACESLCRIYGLFKPTVEEVKDTGAELFVATLQKIWQDNPQIHDK